MKIPTWLIGALLVGGAWYLASGGTFSLSFLQAGAPVNQGGTCSLYGNTQTVNWLSQDSLTSTTTTGSAADVWAGGQTGALSFAGHITTGTTNAVSPAGRYDILMEGNATTGANNFWGSHKSGSVPCEPQTTLNFQQGKMGTMNFTTIINSDGLTGNQAANGFRQTVAGNQCVNLKVRVDSNQTKSYPSNPELNKYVIGFNGNGSTSEWKFSDFQLSGCSKISIPSAISGAVAAAFECTNVPGDFASREHVLTMCAKAGAPSYDNVTISFYPEDYYRNTFTNAVESGVANNADTLVATGGLFTRVIYMNA